MIALLAIIAVLTYVVLYYRHVRKYPKGRVISCRRISLSMRECVSATALRHLLALARTPHHLRLSKQCSVRCLTTSSVTMQCFLRIIQLEHELLPLEIRPLFRDQPTALRYLDEFMSSTTVVSAPGTIPPSRAGH